MCYLRTFGVKTICVSSNIRVEFALTANFVLSGRVVL